MLKQRGLKTSGNLPFQHRSDILLKTIGISTLDFIEIDGNIEAISPGNRLRADNNSPARNLFCNGPLTPFKGKEQMNPEFGHRLNITAGVTISPGAADIMRLSHQIESIAADFDWDVSFKPRISSAFLCGIC
jgi:hypothetical protein